MNRREIILGATALAACGADGQAQPAPAPFPMRRGVNLGNALEAPNEGDWGYRIEDDHLSAIADAGFDGVRLPVRWDAHADRRGDIEAPFMDRVAHVVDTAIARGLIVQLDAHHYQDLYDQPEKERDRFMLMWLRIAQRFRSTPADKLLFEPANEPNGPRMTQSELQRLQNGACASIWQENTDRVVVQSPSNWNNIDALEDWTVWAPDGHPPAVTVHYYEPHAFTHQNAEWLGEEAPRYEGTWGSSADRRRVDADIERAARWGQRTGAMMQLGEFGVNRAVPIQQRATWTRAVREACETHGLGWCVWDFAGAFPIWDRESRAFIPMMRDALFA